MKRVFKTYRVRQRHQLGRHLTTKAQGTECSGFGEHFKQLVLSGQIWDSTSTLLINFVSYLTKDTNKINTYMLRFIATTKLTLLRVKIREMERHTYARLRYVNIRFY